MTRRECLLGLAALPAANASVVVPVHRIVDAKARFPAGSLQRFWSSIWPEAVRDFGHGGIELATTDGAGAVGHTAADRVFFVGLRRDALNLIVTDALPLYWDQARLLAGMTTIDRGYAISLMAVRYAHGDRAPFVSLNTCVHELLHALMGDIFVTHPSTLQAVEREYRIDWYATQLWLFGNGAAVRKEARRFVAWLGSARP